MIIDLDTLFPVRKTFTDIVSYCTDPFASVESKVFASLPADVECGDLRCTGNSGHYHLFFF
ncbi:hypothetical protein OkiPb00408_35130 [Escherichia coli]